MCTVTWTLKLKARITAGDNKARRLLHASNNFYSQIIWPLFLLLPLAIIAHVEIKASKAKKVCCCAANLITSYDRMSQATLSVAKMICACVRACVGEREREKIYCSQYGTAHFIDCVRMKGGLFLSKIKFPRKKGSSGNICVIFERLEQ